MRHLTVQKLLRFSLGGMGTLVLAICAYLGYLKLSGNFHEVLPGTLYRSAQPSVTALNDYVHRYGIKTVINLRGPSDDGWYKDEINASKALNVTHVDFEMSANRQLPLQKAMELISLLKNAQKPVLIHCKAGADRTGLAAVIYLQQVVGVDEDEAEQQLWPIVYGHIGIPFLSSTYAMDQTWAMIEDNLGIEGSTGLALNSPSKAHALPLTSPMAASALTH